jgi:hypothetical protein
MWQRSSGVALLVCGLGCGGAEPGPAEPAPDLAAGESQPADGSVEGTASTEQEPSETGFALSIDGWTDALNGKAQLNVAEGVQLVRLAITGSDRNDVMLMDVSFNDLEDSWVPHHWDIGLPGMDWHSATASIGGQTYHSQGGHVDVSLSANGNITGGFEIALAEDPIVPLGEPIEFVQGPTVRTLTGSFSGQWELFCLSRLPGHQASLIRGGDYCEGLALE